MTTLLGLDIGTTRVKAALFDIDTNWEKVASRRTPVSRGAGGEELHDPESVWEAAAASIREVLQGDGPKSIHAVGVASMAEAGLLVDRASGQPRTGIIPWYDSRASAEAEELAGEDPLSQFARSGLRSSFKYGAAKLLWLRRHDPKALRAAVWLSVADYIAYRLTGRMVTDPTLAARTFLFNIRDSTWDTEWIEHLNFQPSLFPEALPSGQAAGTVAPEAATRTHLARTAPVAVSGHDHICALLAGGVIDPGSVLDSIGTAESVIGILREPELGERGYMSGLAVVPHVLPGRYCWLGGLSAASGSVQWARGLLGVAGDEHGALSQLLQGVPATPTGILYFPYLRGSGAPCPDQRVRAGFVGLDASHGPGHLMKAVLEGTAYEVDSIRRAGQELGGVAVQELTLVGGGAREHAWVQIRADVLGCACTVPRVGEATALGAALAAGLGSRVLPNLADALEIARRHAEPRTTTRPRKSLHESYRHIYLDGYLPVQEALRRYGQAFPVSPSRVSADENRKSADR